MNSPFEPMKISFLESLITFDYSSVASYTYLQYSIWIFVSMVQFPIIEFFFLVVYFKSAVSVYSEISDVESIDSFTAMESRLFIFINWLLGAGLDVLFSITPDLDTFYTSILMTICDLPFYLVSSIWFSFFGLILVLYYICFTFFSKTYSRWMNYFLYCWYKFMYDLMDSYLGDSYMHLYSFFSFIFFFTFFFNLIGMTPYSFSVTSQIWITFSVSSFIWIYSLSIGLSRYGAKYFFLFVQTGIPNVWVLLVIFLELTAFVIRLFSMSLRMFANVVSGHILLHLLVGILVDCMIRFLTISLFELGFSNLLYIVHIGGLCFFFFAEICISLLQSYIQLTLALMYFRDVLSFSDH